MALDLGNGQGRPVPRARALNLVWSPAAGRDRFPLRHCIEPQHAAAARRAAAALRRAAVLRRKQPQCRGALPIPHPLFLRP